MIDQINFKPSGEVRLRHHRVQQYYDHFHPCWTPRTNLQNSKLRQMTNYFEMIAFKFLNLLFKWKIYYSRKCLFETILYFSKLCQTTLGPDSATLF